MEKNNWTPHMIDCLKKYDKYLNGIYDNGLEKEESLNQLKIAAETPNNAGNMGGYAGFLLYTLYDEGKYVEENADKAIKYLELACENGEPMAIAEALNIECDDAEDLDEQYGIMLKEGSIRDYFIWYKRAQIRQFKYRKRWRKYSIGNLFKKIGYRIKALTTIPKQYYFDDYRSACRKALVKDLMGVFLLLLPIIFLLFAII